MSLEHSADHGQFTPRFSRPKHLRKPSTFVDQNYGASRNGEKFRGSNGSVKKLSDQQRYSLMSLLHKIPTMAPVVAMMIDHAPDRGRTIRYPKEVKFIERNDPCDETGVKAKYCTCAACLRAYGNTDEKWEKFEDRAMDAALLQIGDEELDIALSDLDQALKELRETLEERIRLEAKERDEAKATEDEPDVQAVGG